MGFRIEFRQLGDIVVLVPDRFEDERGFFEEVFRADSFQQLGLPSQFMQDNHSLSRKGVVRGLHLQWDPPMGKLMRVTYGCAFLVAVDIRKGSPTFGKWFGIEASAENRRQVWAPGGFARGICALSEFTELHYKCSAIYNSKCESTIRWNDPRIGITWPEGEKTLSEKDRNAQSLDEWMASPTSDHFRYDCGR